MSDLTDNFNTTELDWPETKAAANGGNPAREISLEREVALAFASKNQHVRYDEITEGVRARAGGRALPAARGLLAIAIEQGQDDQGHIMQRGGADLCPGEQRA
jgi:hypothetical protein